MSIRALQVELTAHHNQLLWFCSNGQPLEMSQLTCYVLLIFLARHQICSNCCLLSVFSCSTLPAQILPHATGIAQNRLTLLTKRLAQKERRFPSSPSTAPRTLTCLHDAERPLGAPRPKPLCCLK